MNMDFLLGDFSKSEPVQRARALVPVLRERARAQWEQDHVFDETIKDLKDAGLFGVMQPKRWGGTEVCLSEFYEAVSTVAEADPSVAWVVSVLGVHSYHVAMMGEQAQEDVWGSDRSALVGSPYTPNGKATKVKGGYILSGHWKFSSGSKHCAWTFLGGNVDDGTVPDPKLRYQKNQLAFLLPRSDYEIVDSWEVNGLRATGSHDIIVKDVFVPEHRTLAFADVITKQAPGHLAHPKESLYHMPFFQVFPRATSLPIAVGALKGMADNLVAYGLSRSNAMTRAGVGNTAQDPAVSLAIARALDGVDQMKASMHKAFALMEKWRAEGTADDHMQERRMFRYQTGAGPARCADLASELYRVCGGSGLYQNQPFGRLFNDILAVRSHITNNYQPHATALVGPMMGVETATWPV
jgi:3-hydroxy-9,10-secoandrosta-1,3,5(10)-triene-9,17-dione monooxygenase